MNYENIKVKFRGKVYTLETEKLLKIDDRPLATQVNEGLRDLSWLNTLASRYSRKSYLLRIDWEAKKGTYFMDAKTETEGKPPSDRTVEYEMAEEQEMIDFHKKVAKAKIQSDRIQKLADEVELKIGILRTLMANERAEARLQI